MIKYAKKEDCCIIRDESIYYDKATIIDEEGYVILQLPNLYTDDQIWEIFDIMNEYYSLGVEVGISKNQQEIRNVIGL